MYGDVDAELWRVPLQQWEKLWIRNPNSPQAKHIERTGIKCYFTSMLHQKPLQTWDSNYKGT